MDKIDQIIFANKIPGTISISGGLNISCPYCNEGKSKGIKKRGFILWSDNSKKDVVFYCHNCPASTTLWHLLEDHFSYIYADYKVEERKLYFEKLKSGKFGNKKANNIQKKKVESSTEPSYIKLDERFIPITDHEEGYAYCFNRKIPEYVINKLYYSPANLSIVNNGVESLLPYRDMIIFPFYNRSKIYGFQGRSYKQKFFHTVVEQGWKVYNYFNVDKSKTVYIVESIIDSFYTDNTISSLGSDISNKFLEKLKEPVFCFDNDKSGKRKALKYVLSGYKVFCWPIYLRKVKDINFGITNGYFTQKEICDIIKENIYTGWEAKVRLQL